MKLKRLRSLAPGLAPLLAFCVLAGGCGTSLRSTAPPPTPLADENAAFTVSAEPTRVLDAATVTLVNSNFNITLVNERVGLLQTDYVPISTLQAAWRDSLAGTTRMNRLQMRVTVTVQERAGAQLVQVKGSYQRTGRATPVDDLVARYWLEQLTEDFAASLGVSFRPRITDAMYAEAIREAAAAPGRAAAVTSNNVVRAVAIIAVLLFVATLATGVFSPGTAGGS